MGVRIVFGGLAFLFGWFLVGSILDGHIAEKTGRIWVWTKGRWRTSRNRSRIRAQWGDGLLLMIGALKSGINLEEALEILINESPEPLRASLQQSLGEGARWLSFEDRVVRIFKGPELALVQSALLLSYRTGGKTAQLLDTGARLLRQRREMEEKIGMLTAQGRLSAWIVGLCPFGLMAAFQLVSPELMRPLYVTKEGWMLLGLVVLMVSAGLYLVHQLVRLE